ncbi:MAG: T9SS type A sorting domain-containing protein [Flavobacteriales bacterium]|nr:T9SS type A sorting domain-containing protein [Flavobacteriales bacterium]
MKKPCIFLTGIVVLSSFCFAQKPIEPNSQRVSYITLASQGKSPLVNAPRSSESWPDTIYYEDFGGGSNSSSWVPTGWTNSGINDPDATWEYRGPLTTPNNTIGSRGPCMNSATVLNSPTVGNGFFIFDSNYLDDPGTTCAGALGSGVAPAPHRGELTTDIISTVGYSNVMLVFNYYIRDFQGQQIVEISTNGGTSWTQVWEAGLQPNGQTSLSAKAEILLPPAAANNANLKIRFVFDGRYYAWMLDDVMLVVPNANDLRSTNTEFLIDDFWSYLLFTGGDSSTTQPTHIPLNALDSVQGIGFYQNYENIGSTAQTNVRTTVNVTLNGSSVYTGNSIGITAPVYGSGLLNYVDTWKPSLVGKYIFTYTIQQNETDANQQNNIGRDSLVVTDSVYAREWFPVNSGLVASGLDDEGDAAFANQGTEYFTIANLVDLPSGDTVTSISFRIDPAETRAGAIISVNVLDFQRNPVFPSFPDGIEYTITSQDLTNQWIHIPFYSIPLSERILPASRYYAAVSLVDNISGQKDMSIRYYNNLPYGTIIKRPNGNPIWAFYTGVCAVIRLNFARFFPFSIEENVEPTIQLNNFPNPATNQTTIAFTLKQSTEATLRIADLTGKIIFSQNLGLCQEGLNQIKVDLSGLTNGIYLYTLQAGEHELTRKMSIQK